MDLGREAGGSKQAESAFEKLFLEHYNRIVAVLFRLLGDRPRAEDLASDIFLKLYRRPLLVRWDGNLGGWLYRTAVNLGIDALRSAARHKAYEQEAGRIQLEGGDRAGPLDEALRAEKRRRVHAVLASLKPASAKILILRASGLSYNELTEIMGIKRGSVGTMLLRAEAEFERRYRQRYRKQEGS
jgi:RNA polymerase sigma-70 factor (ECF subfamily)